MTAAHPRVAVSAVPSSAVLGPELPAEIGSRSSVLAGVPSARKKVCQQCAESRVRRAGSQQRRDATEVSFPRRLGKHVFWRRSWRRPLTEGEETDDSALSLAQNVLPDFTVLYGAWTFVPGPVATLGMN